MLLAAISLLTAAGCEHLSHGKVEAIDAPPAAARAGHVYLIRGFQDWYSDGIDALAQDLRCDDVDTQVFAESQWQDVADHLAKSHHSNSGSPLVLVGFSYGADDAILISRELSQRGIRVDLLVTIDPVTPAAVPANVARCVNFYQPNGVMDVFPFLRGIPIHREAGDTAPLQNVNVRADENLVEPNTSHATIAANPKIHAAIERLVLETCRAPDHAG
jgi:hypothetical protein